jgi:hypothetical protein
MGPRTAATTGLTVMLAAVLIVAAGGAATAWASAAAETPRMVTAATANWAAVAVARDATPSAAPHVLIWTVSGNDATAQFDIVNVGDLELVSQRLVLTVSVTQGGGAPDPVELSACVGAPWDPVSDTCAGTTVPLGTSATTPITTGLLLPSGGRVSVRAATTRGTANRTIAVIDTVVSRLDVRPATTTSR